MVKKKSLRFLQFALLISFALSLIALVQSVGLINAMGAELLHSKWTVLFLFLVLVSAVEGIALGLTWTEKGQSTYQAIAGFLSQARFHKVINLLGVFLIMLYPCVMLLSPLRGILTMTAEKSVLIGSWTNGTVQMINLAGRTFIQGSPNGGLTTWGLHWWLFWTCGLIAATLFSASKKDLKPAHAFLAAFLCQMLLYKILSYLPTISFYPFSLWWTEGNRIYYASLVTAQGLYHQSIPLSFMNPTLDILNSVPFWFGINAIFVHRLWRAVLELGITVATALVLSRRLKIENRSIFWLFTFWCILYLRIEEGVYYFLLLSVLIILAGYSARHPWRVLVSLGIASFWAGMSRVNWIHIPSLLVVALYFLEEPVKPYRNIIDYLKKPVLWSLFGVTTAAAGILFVNALKGIDLSQYGAVLSSTLLWYRLLPNPTYPLGILLGAALVSLPLWLIIAGTLRGRLAQWHPARLGGLLAIISILLAGGIISSVKIGGGADLHNLDAYLVSLILVSAYLLFDRFAAERVVLAKRILWPGIALGILIPMALGIRTATVPFPYQVTETDNALQTIRTYVEEARTQGEVLFMDQRQLLTFHEIDVPLVPEYETVATMEYAMWQGSHHLDQFYLDLNRHRFALIVTDIQPGGLKDLTFPNAAENNVWYEEVTQPMLCEYEIADTLPEIGLQLLTPRATQTDCSFSP